MKKFLLAVVLMLCPLIGFAQSTTGYHRVGQVFARAKQSVTAQVVPYAKIKVAVTSTGLAATIYSDPLLSIQITPPVVTADLNGNYDYYMPLQYMVTETISSPGQGGSVVPNVGNNIVNIPFSSPPPIGNVTPNTGAFTNLTSTSGALNGTLGAITPSAVNATSYSVSGVPLSSSNLSDSANLAVHNVVGNWSALQNFNAGLTSTSVNGTLGISDFGIKCDGMTDDSVGLNLIGSTVPAQGWTVSFPPNATCVHSASITTWLKPNLAVIGNGARLKFTGTGHQIYLHSTATETDNNRITGFVLQGNSTTDYNVYNDSLAARGILQITNAQDAAAGCAYLSLIQLYDFVNISCSGQKATLMGVPQTTTPTNGVILGDTGAGLYFANNRYTIIQAEGFGSGVGIWCKRCSNGTMISGTAENSSGTGLQIDATSSGAIFTGVDLEGNTVQDLSDSGRGNSFIGVVAVNSANFHSAAAETFQNFGTLALTDVGGTSVGMSLNGFYVGTATYNGNQLNWSLTNAFDISSGARRTGSSWATILDYLYSTTLATPNLVMTGPISGATTIGAAGAITAGGAFQGSIAPFTTIFAPIGGTDTIFCDSGGSHCASVHAADGSINTPGGYKINALAPLGHTLVGNGTNYVDSTAVPMVGTPVLTQAACFYAAGPPVQLGHCTSVVGATGACTCVYP